MPDLFKEWKQPANVSKSWQEIVWMYEHGYAGALYSAEEKEKYLAEMPHPVAEDICHALGYADSSAGKLVPTWLVVFKCYPSWNPTAQREGSCVAHAGRNQKVVTLCGEVVAGNPDPVSGKLEEAPQVSEAAEKDGVLAWEPGYRYRGHASVDGWYCAADQRVAVNHCGAVVRKNYPGIADLEKNNSSWIRGAWKESQIGAEEKDVFDDHMFAESTEIKTFEALRDLLDRGFGVTSCGSEGFSKSRDENGVSKRSGSWAHAMSYWGVDDRPEIHQRYGGPLVLVMNSWGPKWNSGGRRVLGTDLEIPLGSFWAKWSDLKRRDTYALSGLRGWERKTLPDFNPGW